VGAYWEFDLPDADRVWETEFVGELEPKRKRRSSVGGNSPTLVERSFDEGSDELCLIEDIQENSVVETDTKGFKWLDKDDELLRNLYVDRQCPIEVIAIVFKCDESIIRSHLHELNID
jgi:hypothetical protein